MALTGMIGFRRTLWGKVVLQVEEGRPLWPSRTTPRWRDATQVDLTAPELRPLIDLRFWSCSRFWPVSKTPRGCEPVPERADPASRHRIHGEPNHLAH